MSDCLRKNFPMGFRELTASLLGLEDSTKYTDAELYALKSLEHVKEVLKKTEDNYILLGQLLSEAKTYFKDIPGKNYKNFKVFSKQEFGIAPTTMKDYVRVYEKCCENMQLKEKFKPYNYTQLRELSKLRSDQVDLASPSMSPEEIRSLGKINTDDENQVLNKFIKSPTSFVETFFKNKEERLKFLDTYLSWELYKEVPELTLKFYRIQLTDETYLIATESEYNCSQYYGEYYVGDSTKTGKDVKYTLLNPKDKYSRYLIGGISRSLIAEHLTKNKLGYLKIVQAEL